MPTTKHPVKDTPLPSVPLPRQNFTFPPGSHLLITTPRHIFAWDFDGIHQIFHSSRGGIVAAKESKDGSGILAIASRHVVVMHDTKRGKESSWGLNAPEEEVRHLEYSNDAKSLFLTNTSDGMIQHYSVERSRLLPPTQQHASPPAAVAVSPTGHMVLSASSSPPEVVLRNLAHNSSPTRMLPNASTAAICCAAFHPERPSIFMLAFRDSTVAAYDATRISKDYNRSKLNGEISSLKSLHRSMVLDNAVSGQPETGAPIVAVGFLPGFKTRAVTAGRDGRCRLIDFANGGVVLRTWHAKAPLTSLSVLAVKQAGHPSTANKAESSSRRIKNAPCRTEGGPNSTDFIIAVGRIDGKVHLYDPLGLLLAQKSVSSREETLIGVEWVPGTSPIPVQDSIGHFSDTSSLSVDPAMSSMSRSLAPQQTPRSKLPESTLSQPSGLGLLPGLRPLQVSVGRQFTLHPDEIEAGTVRHTPIAHERESTLPLLTKQYDDLFSPIKPAGADITAPTAAVSSPPRSRPRISSNTFAKRTAEQNEADPRKLSILSFDSHGTSSSSATRPNYVQEAPRSKTAHRASTQLSPFSTRNRHITFKSDLISTGGDATTSRQSTAMRPSATIARAAADLRKRSCAMSQRDAEAYANKQIVQNGSKCNSKDPSSRQETMPIMSTVSPDSERQENPRTAANVFSPLTDHDEGDIWLTSESETEERKRRAKRPLVRPPGRQTWRSQVDSRGTMSTTIGDTGHTTYITRNFTAERAASAKRESFPSAEETPADRMKSTNERVSAHNVFSPDSDNVRQLFPRSSSLSPRHRRSPPVPTRDPALGSTAAALNAAMAVRPQLKSPWARVRAGKSTTAARGSPVIQPWKGPRAVRKNEFVTVLAGDGSADAGLAQNFSSDCLTCVDTQTRVKSLEGEVARLKGEVLALKAVLRQNGLPSPACFR